MGRGEVSGETTSVPCGLEGRGSRKGAKTQRGGARRTSGLRQRGRDYVWPGREGSRRGAEAQRDDTEVRCRRRPIRRPSMHPLKSGSGSVSVSGSNQPLRFGLRSPPFLRSRRDAAPTASFARRPTSHAPFAPFAPSRWTRPSRPRPGIGPSTGDAPLPPRHPSAPSPSRPLCASKTDDYGASRTVDSPQRCGGRGGGRWTGGEMSPKSSRE